MKGGAIFAILLFFSSGFFEFFALFSLVVRLTFLFQMCCNSTPIHFVMIMSRVFCSLDACLWTTVLICENHFFTLFCWLCSRSVFNR